MDSVAFRLREDAYRTIQEADDIVWFLDQYARENEQEGPAQLFFMYVAPLAPHKPSVGSLMLQHDIADVGQGIRLQASPDLNEEDMSDKPAHLRVRKLSEEEMMMVQEEHRKRVVSLISVDNLLKRLLDTLQSRGLLANTYVFLTSDHGYQLGHNRMIAKKLPYHRNTHVPLFVVGPGIKAGGIADHLVSHIDFAPTLLDIAVGDREGRPKEFEELFEEFDGKSLLTLLNNPTGVERDEFRTSLLIENWEEKGQLGSAIPATYSSQRTASTIYNEWSNGAREFYDLESDPFQLNNRFNQLSENVRRRLSDELHALKTGVDQPVATIATAGLVSRRPVLRGFAEDVDAVAGVEVEVNDFQKQVF